MQGLLKKILPGKRIQTEIKIPPDKSLTHRVLMIASVASGVTRISNPSRSADCLSTLTCLRDCGVLIVEQDGTINVHGTGRQGLQKPSRVLNAENSGSTMRMLAGLCGGQPITVQIDGDDSLKKRPMKRIADPLRTMGVHIEGRTGDKGEIYCPLTITGKKKLKAISWHMPVASAQVKTAILLAGLNAHGTTTVHEPYASRDHTERMLSAFGCPVEQSLGNVVRIRGPVDLKATDMVISGDFSSAAFFMVMAAIIPGSSVTLKDVNINKTRSGLIPVLKKMGARISVFNKKTWMGEPVGDIRIDHAPLKGVTVGAEEIPAMIDEVPVLAVAASVAEGTTVIHGAGELKFKESNRLCSIADGLNRMGGRVEVLPDGLTITGVKALKGARVDSAHDHRIAMALAVAALRGTTASEIMHAECVNISFPGFWETLDSCVKG